MGSDGGYMLNDGEVVIKATVVIKPYVERTLGDLRYTRVGCNAGETIQLLDGGYIEVKEEMFAWKVEQWVIMDRFLGDKREEWRSTGISLDKAPPEGAAIIIPDDVFKRENKVTKQEAEAEVKAEDLPTATLVGARISGSMAMPFWLITGIGIGLGLGEILELL